jgi:hypothetical protein
MFKTEQELKNSITQHMWMLARELADSPVSFRTHADRNHGIYVGFCYSKNWDVDLAFLDRIDGPRENWI